MNKQEKNITVMVLDERSTETLLVNKTLFYKAKPMLMGLSVACGALLLGLCISGWYFMKHYSIVAKHESINQNLRQQIEDLKQARSEEITGKMAELAQAEKVVGQLRQYLNTRGVHLPAIPVLKSQDGKRIENAGGPAGKLPPADSVEYRQIMEQLFKTVSEVPLGRPAHGEISSEFGTRSNPFGTGSREFHSGLDFRGPIGDPIMATANGKVEFAGVMNGYGNVVKILHGYGYSTVYAHLNSIDVRVGQMVKAGDKVGGLGSTGRSTGPHLHYEVRLNNEPHDPARFLTLTEK